MTELHTVHDVHVPVITFKFHGSDSSFTDSSFTDSSFANLLSTAAATGGVGGAGHRAGQHPLEC